MEGQPVWTEDEQAWLLLLHMASVAHTSGTEKGRRRLRSLAAQGAKLLAAAPPPTEAPCGEPSVVEGGTLEPVEAHKEAQQLDAVGAQGESSEPCDGIQPKEDEQQAAPPSSPSSPQTADQAVDNGESTTEPRPETGVVKRRGSTSDVCADICKRYEDVIKLAGSKRRFEIEEILSRYVQVMEEGLEDEVDGHVTTSDLQRDSTENAFSVSVHQGLEDEVDGHVTTSDLQRDSTEESDTHGHAQEEQATQHTSSGDAVAADQLVESDMLDCTMDEIVATQHIPNKGHGSLKVVTHTTCAAATAAIYSRYKDVLETCEPFMENG